MQLKCATTFFDEQFGLLVHIAATDTSALGINREIEKVTKR